MVHRNNLKIRFNRPSAWSVLYGLHNRNNAPVPLHILHNDQENGSSVGYAVVSESNHQHHLQPFPHHCSSYPHHLMQCLVQHQCPLLPQLLRLHHCLPCNPHNFRHQNPVIGQTHVWHLTHPWGPLDPKQIGYHLYILPLRYCYL